MFADVLRVPGSSGFSRPPLAHDHDVHAEQGVSALQHVKHEASIMTLYTSRCRGSVDIEEAMSIYVFDD